jgi:DNA-directed RNA polymerase specialized sigma24 family protein
VDEWDEELYRKHADELTRFATGLVGPGEASDVVSAAVFRAMTSRHWPDAVNRALRVEVGIVR